MIISYFNNTKPINIVFLSIILSTLIFSSYYINGDVLFSLHILSKYTLTLVTFISFFLITKDKLISNNSFNILYYVLLSGLFYSSFYDINIIISNLFLILAINQLFALNKKNVEIRKKLFNNGLLIGLASLFYPVTVIYLLLSIVGVVVFNKISWRSFIIPIIGFIVPLLFVFVINDLFKISLIDNFIPLISVKNISTNGFLYNITIVFITLLTFLSISTITININSEMIFYKNYNFITVLLLIVSIIITVFFSTSTNSEILFLIFPLSVIISNYTSLIKKTWVYNLIILVFITLIILNYNF